MESPLVLRDDVEQIAYLTLNNPARRNALSQAMLGSLQAHLQKIVAEPNVRVVILRAAGPVFSSGHDLRELAQGNRKDHAELFALCTRVMEVVHALPQPVIAQVHGLATAAGCQLVASCDLVVASEEASFATPGVKIGLFCTTPGVALARVLPMRKAMEMLLTGEPISAQEAERLGMVNRVVAAARLSEETMQLARKICSASPAIVRLGKQAFYEQAQRDRASAYAFAEPIMVDNACLPDAREGIAAFLEKRTPKWGS